jgi:hypothetical protein
VNDGKTIYEAIPHGAKCKLKFNRAGGKKSAGLEEIETLYRNNARRGNMMYFEVQYVTINRDGGSNARKLIDCKPHQFKLGDYSSDQPVSQEVDFMSGDIQDNS